LSAFTLRPYELLIGLRYTRAKRRNHFISFISLISMLGIALGVAALIVVLSVMNGFQKEVRARILGVTPHLQVVSDAGQMPDWQPLLAALDQQPELRAAAPYVNGQGMVSLNEVVQGVMVRGILPADEQRLTGLGDKMKLGRLDDLRPGEFGITLGSDLARAMGARLGDSVLLITPQGQITPAGMLPRLKQFRVVGIFEVGMSPFDNALVLIHLNDAQKLFRLGDAVSGLSANLHNLDLAPQVARQLGRQLPPGIYASDWTQQNANYFSVVAL
jgi:lipoprotein-releasing system permease protein